MSRSCCFCNCVLTLPSKDGCRHLCRHPPELFVFVFFDRRFLLLLAGSSSSSSSIGGFALFFGAGASSASSSKSSSAGFFFAQASGASSSSSSLEVKTRHRHPPQAWPSSRSKVLPHLLRTGRFLFFGMWSFVFILWEILFLVGYVAWLSSSGAGTLPLHPRWNFKSSSSSSAARLGLLLRSRFFLVFVFLHRRFLFLRRRSFIFIFIDGRLDLLLEQCSSSSSSSSSIGGFRFCALAHRHRHHRWCCLLGSWCFVFVLIFINRFTLGFSSSSSTLAIVCLFLIFRIVLQRSHRL